MARQDDKTPRLADLIDDPVKFAEVMGFELQPWQEKLLRQLAGSPSIETTGTKFTPETLRRGIEAMKAGDAKRRAMPFPASETGEPVTSYTVAREAERKNAAQEWLIAYDEVKLILDNTVKVGTTDGKTMVFNKREAAAKITQIVNDRFNARRQP